jgi:hypothetical protein
MDLAGPRKGSRQGLKLVKVSFSMADPFMCVPSVYSENACERKGQVKATTRYEFAGARNCKISRNSCLVLVIA